MFASLSLPTRFPRFADASGGWFRFSRQNATGTEKATPTGSGFVWDRRGYIVTSATVVAKLAANPSQVRQEKQPPSTFPSAFTVVPRPLQEELPRPFIIRETVALSILCE